MTYATYDGSVIVHCSVSVDLAEIITDILHIIKSRWSAHLTCTSELLPWSLRLVILESLLQDLTDIKLLVTISLIKVRISLSLLMCNYELIHGILHLISCDYSIYDSMLYKEL